MVSDFASFAWVCDVSIETNFQKQGLAIWLMQCLREHPELQLLRRWCLTTKDAHSLYEKSGFRVTATPHFWMEIKDNEIYKKLYAQGVGASSGDPSDP